MDTLPPEDIERETLWHLYVDLLQDYEVLQEEKSRLWDIIQRNMQSHSDELEKMRVGFLTILAKMEHQEGVIAQMQLELQTYAHAQIRVNNEESGKRKISPFPFLLKAHQYKAQTERKVTGKVFHQC